MTQKFVAKPKIADYPFTTLEPNLGVVRYDDVEFVVADIPGLIEGAADGKGLGHKFLRHVERARVLVVLIDLASTEGRAPSDQVDVLLNELEKYQPDLIERPRLIIGTKSDVATAPFDGMKISAVTHDGIEQFKGVLADLISRARAEAPKEEVFTVHRPTEEGFSITRADDGTWIVKGRGPERAVAMSDLTNPEALDYLQERFRKIGVERALARAGAHSGDIVRIGEVEMEYEEESM